MKSKRNNKKCWIAKEQLAAPFKKAKTIKTDADDDIAAVRSSITTNCSTLDNHNNHYDNVEDNGKYHIDNTDICGNNNAVTMTSIKMENDNDDDSSSGIHDEVICCAAGIDTTNKNNVCTSKNNDCIANGNVVCEQVFSSTTRSSSSCTEVKSLLTPPPPPLTTITASSTIVADDNNNNHWYTKIIRTWMNDSNSNTNDWNRILADAFLSILQQHQQYLPDPTNFSLYGIIDEIGILQQKYHYCHLSYNNNNTVDDIMTQPIPILPPSFVPSLEFGHIQQKALAFMYRVEKQDQQNIVKTVDTLTSTAPTEVATAAGATPLNKHDKGNDHQIQTLTQQTSGQKCIKEVKKQKHCVGGWLALGEGMGQTAAILGLICSNPAFDFVSWEELRNHFDRLNTKAKRTSNVETKKTKKKNVLKVKATIIITTNALLGQWQDECKLLVPNLRVERYHPPSKHQHTLDLNGLMNCNDNNNVCAQQLVQADIILTTATVPWPTIITNHIEFHRIIIDEAHLLGKTGSIINYQTVMQFQSYHRWCNTPTPTCANIGYHNITDFERQATFLGYLNNPSSGGGSRSSSHTTTYNNPFCRQLGIYLHQFQNAVNKKKHAEYVGWDSKEMNPIFYNMVLLLKNVILRQVYHPNCNNKNNETTINNNNNNDIDHTAACRTDSVVKQPPSLAATLLALVHPSIAATLTTTTTTTTTTSNGRKIRRTSQPGLMLRMNPDEKIFYKNQLQEPTIQMLINKYCTQALGCRTKQLQSLLNQFVYPINNVICRRKVEKLIELIEHDVQQYVVVTNNVNTFMNNDDAADQDDDERRLQRGLKIVIFTNNKSTHAACYTGLRTLNKSINLYQIGGTSSNSALQYDDIIRQFQLPIGNNKPIVLICRWNQYLGSNVTNINLSTTTNVYFVEPWLDPMVECQALCTICRCRTTTSNNSSTTTSQQQQQQAQGTSMATTTNTAITQNTNNTSSCVKIRYLIYRHTYEENIWTLRNHWIADDNNDNDNDKEENNNIKTEAEAEVESTTTVVTSSGATNTSITPTMTSTTPSTETTIPMIQPGSTHIPVEVAQMVLQGMLAAG